MPNRQPPDREPFTITVPSDLLKLFHSGFHFLRASAQALEMSAQRQATIGRRWGQIKTSQWGQFRASFPHVDTVIEGDHASAPEAEFSRLVVRFDQLPVFIGLSGLSVESSTPGKRVAVEWEPTPSRTEMFESVSLTFGATGTFGWISDFEYSLEHAAFVELHSDVPRPLRAWDADFISPLLCLASFGLGAWPENVIVFAGQDPMRVRIYTAQRAVIGPRHRYQPILFDLEDLPAGAVATWLGLRTTKRRDAFDLFAESELISPSVLPQSQILDAARFIEVFHRRRWPGGQLSPKAHAERVAAVVEAAPDEHRAWLKETLGMSNELRLRDRIVRLLDVVGTPVASAIGDPETFARSAANTRNYHTHYSSGLRRRAVTGIDLVRLADRLSLLVRACMLAELGLAEEAIERMLTRDRNFVWLEGDL